MPSSDDVEPSTGSKEANGKCHWDSEEDAQVSLFRASHLGNEQADRSEKKG